MDQQKSFAALALAGVERMREKDCELRGRVAALPLLLRGAYFTGEGKWRSLAEEDLRALWRSGVHDHVGGGFFSAGLDREWLRPVFEKRLDDNAILAFLYAEAWEKGRMAFYREAAEETLDWILRELPDPSGLYRAGQRAADNENPYLFTPAQIDRILGGEKGRGFAACWDVTDEGNLSEGLSIPNLILNQRWNLIPEGYDDLRERVRLAREARGGVLTDPRTPFGANALLLAALAKAARVFSDRRYLFAAEELRSRLAAGAESLSPAERAALAFALTELYAADFAPDRIAAAAEIAPAPERLSGGETLSPENDRALSLAALAFDALWHLTGDEREKEARGAVLRELCLRPERHGPESLGALCALLAASHPERVLLCVCPGEEPPAALDALRARYAPDLTLLLKTPARAAALAAACPWTAPLPIGEESLFYPREDGKTGAPHRL
ncbi:MAG: thioredoxin domain-containing protein [Oscillospiraceae bacterium]|nr:thioredoxin domain-containing protein [Oscillospiraceae bacterium]